MSAHTTTTFQFSAAPTRQRFWRTVPRRLAMMLAVRRARRELARMDPRMLKDIGVTYCEADAELTRAFWDIGRR